MYRDMYRIARFLPIHVPRPCPHCYKKKHVCAYACLLTYVSRAFGDRKVRAGAPRSALVTPLAAATVGPRGVVLALAAQLLFVKYAAVGVKVALAPVREGNNTGNVKARNVNEHEGISWRLTQKKNQTKNKQKNTGLFISSDNEAHKAACP